MHHNEEIEDRTVPTKLPRKGLREEAFRRFEHHIAKACYATHDIHPKDLMASSWISMFNDARRGFRMFHYHSDMIPKGYDVMMIRPHELSNGQVRLENTYEDTQKEKRAMMGIAESAPMFENRVFTYRDLEGIEKFLKEVGDDIGDTETIIVQCEALTQVHEMFLMLKERLKSKPRIIVSMKEDKNQVLLA